MSSRLLCICALIAAALWERAQATISMCFLERWRTVDSVAAELIVRLVRLWRVLLVVGLRAVMCGGSSVTPIASCSVGDDSYFWNGKVAANLKQVRALR